MDFSSPERALTSLVRRNPPLPEAIKSVSASLLDLYVKKDNSDGGSTAPCSDTSTTTSRGDQEMTSIFALLGVDTDNGDDYPTAVKDVRWECLAVGLLLASHWLERHTRALLVDSYSSASSSAAAEMQQSAVYADGPRQPCLVASSTENMERSNDEIHINDTVIYAHYHNVDFCERVVVICQRHLEHDEPRVRTLVARVIGAHSKYTGLISRDSNNDNNGVDVSSQLIAQRNKISHFIGTSLKEHAAMYDEDRSLPGPDFQAPALDDTTGWRALETSLIALASWINGCGGTYVDQFYHGEEGSSNESGVELSSSLLIILEGCSAKHINRHVRAAGLQCLEQIIRVSSLSTYDGSNEQHVLHEGSELRDCVVRILTVCLADNWSQVRMAASVLNREFLVAVRKVYGEESLVPLFPALLPRMCLNRFYLAQGVKLYSQDTWKLIFDPAITCFTKLNGAEEVSKCAGAVCRYYVKMCDADNHVVREASCQAVAEIAERLGCNEEYAPYLAPFVPMLLQALILCFHDESWPVRDEACLACGKFVKAYPEECLDDLGMLFERWTDHLCDQIWSVREDAAVALGDALLAYEYKDGGAIILEPLLAILKERIPLAKTQPAMTREELIASHNDAVLHTDSQLYSCGSLAPKLKKRSTGGCSDCKVRREKMPWEATDGCVYMVRELCRHRHLVKDEVLLPIFEALVDACRVKHFPQGDDLRATLWNQLPVMAESIGKTTFKRKYLHMFIELLMDNVSSKSASALSVHAASHCCHDLATLVGKGIFRGRCEEFGAGMIFDSCYQSKDLNRMGKSVLRTAY
mmetsp:Transcript_14590/g.22519  ORF Transcript_14590/g.22519 Transcript_14590/m.22519 type:complete len:810 (+) Transcript_14590:25-2454(+)|eukprot:CAMPEP_0196807704 /NCGR_PEP_ID=MMETSP1362-20130617/7707_1 /TAXON_ID=163516 /ORGANISM="Leptocylindrus danicus, Strain CCMP1856" /LENGTH=809 /DNA_ID=CAMNT_0042181747 /DNA_START=25 /DNA_END=2454 /DNA_ORIENTATION=+